MKNKLLAFFALLSGLFLWLFIKSCDGPEEALDTALPPQDVLRIGVRHNSVTVQTQTEKETQYVPDSGSVEVTVDKDGTVDLQVQNKGVTFRPAMGPFISDHLGLALGAEVAYWNRFEVYTGIVVPHDIGAFIAAGYRLDQIRLNNTSLYVGIDTHKNIGAGILVKF